MKKLLFLLMLTLLAGCASNVEDEYADVPAFFRFTPVTSAAPLYQALNNPGIFCKIWFQSNTIYFRNAQGVSATATKTALYNYQSIEFISGFIVGTPSLSNVSGAFYQVAYDLCCPTCYDESYIQRSLDFDSNEVMKCSRCGRTYDLMNGGIILSGGQGSKLKQYHLTYGGDVMVISN